MFDILRPFYIELLRVAWRDAGDTVGRVLGDFSLENENVQRILKELAKRCTGIDETIEQTIQDLVGRQASEGWTLERLTQELADRAVTNAELISVTETADAYTRGSILAYRESGVVTGIEWLLGPEPCEQCQEIAQSTPIAELGAEFAPGISHPPAHPRCTCAAAPILAST